MPETATPSLSFEAIAKQLLEEQPEAERRLTERAEKAESARTKFKESATTFAAGQAPEIEAAKREGAQFAAEAQQRLPGTPVLPGPPSRGLHAFLAPMKDETPETSLAKAIEGIALFGTMIAGGRAGARASLSALTGAMEGWQAGDRERADRAFVDWRAKTATLLEQYDKEQTAYNRWFQAKGLGLTERLRGLELEARNFGNHALADKIDVENADQSLANLKAIQDQRTKLLETVGKLAESHELGQLRLQYQEQARQQTEVFRQEMLRGRQERFNDMPLPGVWFSRETGERAYPTRGEQRNQNFPERFHQSNTVGETRYEQISIAMPMIKELRRLVPKLLATQPAENLVKALELAGQGKLAASGDLRAFQALVEDVNVKMTAVMGPGQFRVTLMRILRGIGLHTADTQETAGRVLDQWETNIENDLRAITGQQMREHLVGPWRGKVMKPDGAAAWVELEKGERLPPGYVWLEEVKSK